MQNRIALILSVMLLPLACRAADPPARQQVGPVGDGSFIVPTRQVIRPAGQSVEYKGRPIDLLLSPDSKSVYVKDGSSILVLDAGKWTLRQQLALPKEHHGSMHGLAMSRDGARLYVTASPSALCAGTVGADGALTWKTTIALAGSVPKRDSYPCGVALSSDGSRAYVCLSMNNSLAIVDLEKGKVAAEIPVGVAPYGVVLSPDGRTAYVSNWGGRRPRSDEKTAKSGGTDTLVDARGIASSGTLGIIDLEARRELAQLETGLHPSDLVLSNDGKTLYVANANSDTVSVIDTTVRRVTATLSTRPDPALPFGSASNALCLSNDARTLYVANGGNNALAVLPLETSNQQPATPSGFIPAGWYPAAVTTDGHNLFIANTKGVGSRDPSAAGKWSSKSYRASITKVPIPDAPKLAKYTQQVHADALIPQSLKAWEKAASPEPPAPVPAHVGQPSVFDHIVYIIKENRTYDQFFGDFGKGNSDPSLCVFGRKITPNHHALAEQFALLDNFYCNGVVSADGHAWATEGTTVDYLEKSFGAFVRSYPFSGDDPLAFAASGFIWDSALLHGLSFRNYGEMGKSKVTPDGRFPEVYHDYLARAGRFKLEHIIYNDSLRQYSCPNAPGWNLHIPDQIRADVFLAELKDAEAKGTWPNLMVLYLPSDHTSGTAPKGPTPNAMIADNDLALGRVVDAISHSRFWPKTCIFVIEDDPQAGFDHVDGHRSLCLVISPYTKRNAVVSYFYNQTSVLHTIELMLGLPPMTQLDAMAPAMRECFTNFADLAPYANLPSNIPLDQINPPATALSGKELDLAIKSTQQRLDGPDLADEDTLNRILWHYARGADVRYPAELAGAHGKGLVNLHLMHDARARDSDDD